MSGGVCLYWNGDDGGERPDGWGRVLLHPHQPPHNIVLVAGPPVDVCVLEPAGHVTLGRGGEGRGI